MRNIFNFLLFQIQWSLCVFNVHHSFFYALSIFVVQIIILLCKKNYLNFLMTIILSLIGILFDTLLMNINVLVFPAWQYNFIIPAWLATLWFCFSLWYVKADYINKKLFSYTALCVIFGPLSYYTGMKLGALNFGVSLLKALLIISLNWFLLAVIFFIIYKIFITLSIAPLFR